MISQPLLDYIKGQAQKGVPTAVIKRTLLDNEWAAADVEEAFLTVGLVDHGIHGGAQNNGATDSSGQTSSVRKEGITMDKIIEKFVPIVGALFLVIGLGYLIYANAWVHLSMEIRLGLGFFASLVIIGGSFSLSERLTYLTDIGIGSGVLMLYGTLIYGSRATELSAAIIPEFATLGTAAVFTLLVCYFASKRNSKVILTLGMVGAYITPFVIGQNDVWVQNVSFNAYLIYFLAVNVAVFFIGREISVRDMIPLNIVGMFIGVTTLWGLASSNGIDAAAAGNVMSGQMTTGILFAVLVIFSMWSILLSAKRFSETDDGYLSLGYIAPVVWFIFNIGNLTTLTDFAVGVLYSAIAVASFVGWHVLRGAETRFQHTALYASGLLSAIIAFFTFLQELNVYTSIFVAYASLVFAALYMFDASKTERWVSYAVISLMGSILSLHHILDANLAFETVYIIVAMVPAMSAILIAKKGGREEFYSFARLYSVMSVVITALFVFRDLLEYIDASFLIFYILPLAGLAYIAYVHKFAHDDMTHDSKSTIMRLVLGWFAFGFVGVFFYLFASVYPAPMNTTLLDQAGQPIDWALYKGIFATVILFLGLWISRQLQLEQVIKRPSFILVIFGFSTMLLTGNYIINALMNDLGVSMAEGGPRAIATTIWWVAIAVYMLYVGIAKGKKYHAEKLLGLVLLMLSVGKVILYDIATMGMQNKIIVLMVVGGAMLMFSYVVHSKNMLKEAPEAKGE